MKLIAYKKRLITIAIAGGLMLLVSTVQAQLSSDYLRAADNYFRRADYSSASTYYEKFLQGGGKVQAGQDPYAIQIAKKPAAAANRLQAVYQLAESYRLLTNYEKAAPLYQQVAEGNAAQFPLAAYHYATVLRALGKYAEAEKAMNGFVNTYTGKDNYSATAQRELQNLRFIQQQLKKGDAAEYTITKISEGKEGASYAPVATGNNTLLFTATWTEGGKGHTNHLFSASYQNGALSGVDKASLPATDLHEGAASISADGNTLYLTRWQVKDGKKAAAVYSSKKGADGKWQTPVALNAVVNTPGANAQQPFIMPDGKQLLFVSDKQGGHGGYDIWLAELNVAGEPVSVANLGTTVNTPFNEQAPYYHAPSSTLVFASEGRVGMGGYDLFYSKGAPGHGAEAENFGYPVNSVKDDMYFTSLGNSDNILEQAVFSSDRLAVCCLELMQLKKPAPVAVVPPVVDSTPIVKAEPVEKEPVTATPVEEVVILENVFYEINKASITPPSYPSLDKIAARLKSEPGTRVEISGHTDDTGSEEWNQQLSEQRAAHVVAYLVSKGVEKERLTFKGYGASKPVAPNKNEDGTDNPEGRRKNRRTEMRIVGVK